MPIGLGGVAFEGPYSRHEMLCRRPGVFAVLDGRSLPPLHAEKTDDVRQAVEDHAGRDDWGERCDNLAFAVFYTSVDRNQRRVERAVRDEYDLHVDRGEPPAAEGRPAANGRPAPSGRDDGTDAAEPRGRSFPFHVPAHPGRGRRIRAS